MLNQDESRVSKMVYIISIHSTAACSEHKDIFVIELKKCFVMWTYEDAERHDDIVGLAVFYAALGLGFPGNILSLVVWTRRQFCISSSALFLSALAVNDFIYLLTTCVVGVLPFGGWSRLGALAVQASSVTVDSLLIFCLSVDRLFSVRFPLQVCIHSTLLCSATEHFLAVGYFRISQLASIYLPPSDFKALRVELKITLILTEN